MVEAGEYVAGPLYRTAALAYRFNTYAKIVSHRRTARPDVRYPFHHMEADGGGKRAPNPAWTVLPGD